MKVEWKVGRLYRLTEKVPGLSVWPGASLELGPRAGKLGPNETVILLAVATPEEHGNSFLDCDLLRVLTPKGIVGWVITNYFGTDLFSLVERP